MLIAAEQRLIARLGVEPEDSSRITPGTPVTIRSVFVPDVHVESEVREVHAMVDPGTHLVEVLAPIPEKQVDRLVLGSRILGSIHLASHPALVVPRSAVLGDGDEGYLFTVAGGKAKRVGVRVGTETDRWVEISGDVAAGDRVVTSGNHELEDGMAVREAP